MKIIIAGFGSLGSALYDRLKSEGRTICILEQNEGLQSKIEQENHPDTQFIVADAADYLTYSQDSLKNADVFYALTEQDETNLIACKLAKDAGAKKTICRANHLDPEAAGNIRRFDFLGIDQIVNLNEIVADEFFRLTRSPNAPEYCPLLKNHYSILGFRISKESVVCNRKISDVVRETDNKDFYPAGLEKKNVTYFLFDDEDLSVQEGDMLYFFCDNKKLQELRTYLGYKREKEKNVMIYGNSEVGERLVYKSEAGGFRVKYIDPDPKSAAILSDKFNEAMVLNFDGVDEKKMLDEGLEEVDYFFAAGDNLSKNICSSILATKNGVQYTFCSSPQKEYTSICEDRSLIFLVLCPTLIMVDFLYRFSYNKEISNYFALRKSKVEIFEFEIKKLNPYLQKNISELWLPEEVKIFLIQRKEKIFRPRDSDEILEGDRIIVFSHYCDRKKVLDLFFENPSSSLLAQPQPKSAS